MNFLSHFTMFIIKQLDDLRSQAEPTWSAKRCPHFSQKKLQRVFWWICMAMMHGQPLQHLRRISQVYPV